MLRLNYSTLARDDLLDLIENEFVAICELSITPDRHEFAWIVAIEEIVDCLFDVFHDCIIA